MVMVEREREREKREIESCSGVLGWGLQAEVVVGTGLKVW